MQATLRVGQSAKWSNQTSAIPQQMFKVVTSQTRDSQDMKIRDTRVRSYHNTPSFSCFVVASHPKGIVGNRK